MKQRNSKSTALRRTLILSAAGLAAGVAALFVPWASGDLRSEAHPALSDAAALDRIESLQAERSAQINPVCRPQLLTHGQKVDQAILLVHGYTSCPEQFRVLGEEFYALGYNVLIAPLPHHGLADRMTDELSQFSAEELAAYADELVDLGQGLGDAVTMLGISGGGVTTAWAAQNRSDLDQAVIISPAFGFQQIPSPLTAPVMNVYRALPDHYEWWDPEKMESAGPQHAYPRYSRHALAEILRLAFAVRSAAADRAPAAGRLVVITNANDTSVNNAITAQVVQDWRAHGAQLETYEFPLSLGLGHDLIDPAQPDAQIDVVYPQLIEWISD